MRKVLAAIGSALLVASILTYGQSNRSLPLSENERPASWFVELSSPPVAEGSSMANLEREESAFQRSASAAGVRYIRTRHFHKLWNGVTVKASGAEVAKLRALPGVRAVYPVGKVRLKQAETQTQAPPSDLVTGLEMTGADVAQKKIGVTGKGVRVAVIDTGIDYDHPDLGGCFGPGCRVEKGFDLVGDDFDPDLNPNPVPDPYPDDCNGHGTHVSGIIGANGAIKGVAPDVTFHVYRVGGCQGDSSDDILLAAMEMALDDGADVLNMSIGAAYGWPQYPTAQAANRLVKLGTAVVSSIGNEGETGLYSADTPAVGRRVIGVASFDAAFANLSAFTITPDDLKIGYVVGEGAPIPPTFGSFQMSRTGTTSSIDDACSALPPGSLTGAVALIRRGTCPFATKAANAQAAGAAGVVFYNNVSGFVSPTVAGAVPIAIPIVSISDVSGARIDQRLQAGSVQMTWTSQIVGEPQPTGNRISSFSSYGVSPDLSLKPDIGAPGGTIRSTLPLEQGGYGNLSGTSMSSPHVAGAIALLLQARPHIKLSDVATRLQNTARPHGMANSTAPVMDSVHRQGAGLLEIDDAIRADALVTPSKISIGEMESGTAQWTIHLRRDRSPIQGRTDPVNSSQVVYTLGHEPALSTGPDTFVPTFLTDFATVKFSTRSVTLGGGGNDATIVVTFTPPAAKKTRLFGGYITLTPDNGGPILRVPYAGYHGDYQAITALTAGASGLPWLAKVDGTDLINQPDGASFTLEGDDLPVFAVHLDHEVAELKMEVIDVESGRSFNLLDDETLLPRNSSPTAIFAIAWDGTTFKRINGPFRPVPNGTYRIELSVLKALGDPHNPDHFEHWTSPPVTLARPITP